MDDNTLPESAGLVTAAVLRSKISGTWRALARCRGVDPDVFHPLNDDDATEAKAICDLCPVREVCLEHAIAAREKHGVWGGLTERERRRLVRRRRRTA
jgi:WhiB family redox-sensing transcriptional regulator